MKTAFPKIIFALMWLVAISSCEKDSCKHVSCPSGLECSHGSCVCPDGYQGTNCDTLSYPKYTGEYLVTEGGCSNFPAPYYVNIIWGGTADSLPQLLYVSPMFRLGPAELLLVNLPGSLGINFNVPQQIIGTGTSEISLYGTGSGDINSSSNTVINIELSLTYTFDDGSSYSCTETLTKR